MRGDATQAAIIRRAFRAEESPSGSWVYRDAIRRFGAHAIAEAERRAHITAAPNGLVWPGPCAAEELARQQRVAARQAAEDDAWDIIRAAAAGEDVADSARFLLRRIGA